jgi:hypothetical protein
LGEYLRRQLVDKDAQIKALNFDKQEATRQARRQGYMRGRGTGYGLASWALPVIPEMLGYALSTPTEKQQMIQGARQEALSGFPSLYGIEEWT